MYIFELTFWIGRSNMSWLAEVFENENWRFWCACNLCYVYITHIKYSEFNFFVSVRNTRINTHWLISFSEIVIYSSISPKQKVIMYLHRKLWFCVVYIRTDWYPFLKLSNVYQFLWNQKRTSYIEHSDSVWSITSK